jgi:endonuclease YncB( thermonuclease family)
MTLAAFSARFAFVIVGSNFLPPANPPSKSNAAPPSFTCTVASVHDGDTLRCLERGPDGRQVCLRISGIDARELDGTCAPGHPCASAPPEAATAALERLVAGQRLQCEFEGYTYRRMAGFCRNAAGVDVSCAMLASGTVAKWARYWGDHRCR